MNYSINNIDFLKQVYELLKNNSIETYIFGGWAEELHGMTDPRNHKDIDLLYISNNWEAVDSFLEIHKFEVKKIFSHKRAFLYQGILIELFLVSKENDNYHTNFFSKYLYTWPISTFTDNSNLKICSTESLIDYRKKHPLIHTK